MAYAALGIPIATAGLGVATGCTVYGCKDGWSAGLMSGVVVGALVAVVGFAVAIKADDWAKTGVPRTVIVGGSIILFVILSASVLGAIFGKRGVSEAEKVASEASARVAELEALVVRSVPRRISETAMVKLSDALRSSPGKIEISKDMGAQDCKPFAEDFVRAFQNAGWSVGTNEFSTLMSHPPETGLGVVVVNPSELTQNQRMIMKAFDQANIPYNVIDRAAKGIILPAWGQLRIEGNPDAELLITERRTR